MGALIPEVQGTSSGIVQVAQETLRANFCCIFRLGTTLFAMIRNAFSVPIAFFTGNVIALSTGSNSVVGCAAKTVLVIENTLALREEKKETGKALQQFADAITAVHPTPVHWLKQKGSYDPSIQNTCCVSFHTNTPELVTRIYYRSEVIVQATGRLLWRALRCAKAIYDLGTSFIFDPLMRYYAVSNIPLGLFRISKYLENDPLNLVSVLEANQEMADALLKRIGSPWTAKEITEKIKSGINAVVASRPKIAQAVNTLKVSAQLGSFTLVNMTTGLHIAPFGLPAPSNPQNLLRLRKYYEAPHCPRPSRPAKVRDPKSRFF